MRIVTFRIFQGNLADCGAATPCSDRRRLFTEPSSLPSAM